MILYEITNRFIGESYVRVYVWAQSEDRAKALAIEAFKKDAESRGSDLYECEQRCVVKTCRVLFAAWEPEFFSIPSDSGFNDGDL